MLSTTGANDVELSDEVTGVVKLAIGAAQSGNEDACDAIAARDERLPLGRITIGNGEFGIHGFAGDGCAAIGFLEDDSARDVIERERRVDESEPHVDRRLCGRKYSAGTSEEQQEDAESAKRFRIHKSRGVEDCGSMVYCLHTFQNGNEPELLREELSKKTGTNRSPCLRKGCSEVALVTDERRWEGVLRCSQRS